MLEKPTFVECTQKWVVDLLDKDGQVKETLKIVAWAFDVNDFLGITGVDPEEEVTSTFEASPLVLAYDNTCIVELEHVCRDKGYDITSDVSIRQMTKSLGMAGDEYWT